MAKLSCFRAALEYASRGWHVFPLNGKLPFKDTHGHRDATIDAAQIRAWWKQWPNANVGIACSSKHGPIVVDIDGESGWTLLRDIEIAPTRCATSGRPYRMHMYFGPMRNGSEVPRTIKLKRGDQKYAIDVLGDGGYVVAPPSVHPETQEPYFWTSNAITAPFPTVLYDLVLRTRNEQGTDRRGPAPPMPDIIAAGERDEMFTSLAGTMRRRGASEDAILAALREENATRCDPPLPDRQLRKIARSIAQKPPLLVTENLTDLGNARRFVATNQTDVRAVPSRRRPWMIWEGVRWTNDETGEVERKAKDTVRQIAHEATMQSDPELAEKVTKHAMRSEGASSIRHMLELAATEPEITTTVDQLDNDPWLLNLENGTLDLRTGKLRAHRRTDLITRLSSIEYDESASCERWKLFLSQAMGGDNELVDFLQRAVGYALTGDTREQCLFFCYGHGANGKSTFLEIIRELAGEYGQQAEFSTFMARNGEGPRNDLARMRGARLVTASEAPSNKPFDETVLKRLTGDDTIVARQLYEEFFEFKPQHKIFLAANHKPIVKEQTLAFWRRMRLIPFDVTIPPKQRDKDLLRKLREELPGILAWAVEGCLRWQRDGLHQPRAVKLATKSYRDENDLIGEFIDRHAALDTKAWTSTVELYRVFCEWWTETRGPRTPPIQMVYFGRMLGEREALFHSKRGGSRGWSGIALRQEMGA
jgi:putative DNA primase/helicase